MMKKETKKEIPSSSLRTFQKSFESVGKEQINVLEELQKDITTISQKIDRSVDVNIELQTKIADMMSQMASLVESFKEIARFLKGGQMPENIPTMEEERDAMTPSIEPFIEVGRPEIKTDITAQLKELVNQNRDLTETLRSLETALKKSSTKEMIKKALEKSHMK